MEANVLKFKKEARELVIAGVDELAEAVTSTLGPKGRNVAIDLKWGPPKITHDGVTVARGIERLKDPFKNMGAQMVKEASVKTNDTAGDGTTTATLLAQAIVHAGHDAMKQGANPMILRHGIERAVQAVSEEIKKMAKPVKTVEEKAEVAEVSSADAEVGEYVAQALEKVGIDGVITVEASDSPGIFVEYREGMEFDKGYALEHFVTDPQRMEAVIEDPWILLTDKNLSSAEDVTDWLVNIASLTKKIVVIANDVNNDALATLVVNKLRGKFEALVIRRPGLGDRGKQLMEDIAALTGGRVISEDTGDILANVKPEDFGRADRIVSSETTTSIIGGRGDKKRIAAQINKIRTDIEKAPGDHDKEVLKDRLAKLTTGVAVIRVGGTTETEMKERRFRVEDAVHATKAASEEGIVPGGGVALLKARKVLDKLEAGGDEKRGIEIIRDALTAPVKKIAENAGASPNEVLAQVESSPEGWGYNALTGKYGPMIASGIVDPAKVTRLALQNGAAVAALILTTDTLISEEDDAKEAPHPYGPRA